MGFDIRYFSMANLKDRKKPFQKFRLINVVLENGLEILYMPTMDLSFPNIVGQSITYYRVNSDADWF